MGYKQISQITLPILLAITVFAQFSPTAQAADVLKKICDEKPNSAVCKDNNPNPGPNNNPIFGTNGILTEIINIVSILIGIAAVVMIIVAGLKFITSGSNPQDVTAAREMIIYALLGLVVAVSAQLLVRFILSKL